MASIEILQGGDLLFVGIAIVAIGIFGFIIYSNNRESATNRAFLFFSLAVIFWSAINYFSYQFNNQTIILWSLRLVIFFATWYSFFLFRLFFIFPAEKIDFPKWYKRILLPLVIFTSLLALTPAVFFGLKSSEGAGEVAVAIPNTGIALFGVLVISLTIGGIFILIRKLIRADKKDKRSFYLVLIGATTTLFLHLLFNFILPVFFDNVRFIPLGALFTFPFVAFTAYAIVKYKLLNIKVIATELLTFAVWMAILVELLLAEGWRERLLEAGLFGFVVVFGILLIRSVRKEVEQREYLEVITKELGEANEKLKELDDLKTDFISIASHQLRTPLTAIKGYTSMIMEGSYGEVSERVRGTIGKVFQSAQRLIYIVNDLLDISRIEQGRFTIALEPIKVANVLKDVVEELQQNAKTKNLSLELAVAPENMEVTASADFNKIRQVFLNVIDNAIKYTNEGYVRVSVEPQTDKVLVSVKDSGLGISQETMKNLFQKFSRAKGVTKLHTDGSGLGLFIVKKIMEAHGGNVWAESEGEGKGSQFYVSIPLQKG